MKERVLELLEELVSSHTLSQKRAKADEIAAIVKTAVFVADDIEARPATVPSALAAGWNHDPSLDAAGLLRFQEESPADR